jgi:hypothetical protein
MAKKLVLEISRDDETNEAFISVKSHSIDSDWTSGLLYLILNRYMHNMPESMQNKFFDETLAKFIYLLEGQQGAALMDIKREDEDWRS